jgi:hypothetical protein
MLLRLQPIFNHILHGQSWAARVVGEVRCIRIYTYTYISNSTINDVFILSIVYQDLYPDMVRIY